MDVGKVISQFGKDTVSIGKLLLEDDELCKLLYYSDNPIQQSNIEDKYDKLLHKNIVVNTEAPIDKNKGSYILININNFNRNQTNNATMDVVIFIDIIVPTDDWVLKDGNLRPYAIMEKVANIMNNVNIDSIGDIDFGGATEVVLGNGLSGYSMKFANYKLGV